MKDFKSIIREKYDTEVQPQFSEDAWKSFALNAGLQEEKKKRRIGWWWFMGILLLGLSLPLMGHIFGDDEEPMIEDYKEIIAEGLKTETTPITEELQGDEPNDYESLSNIDQNLNPPPTSNIFNENPRPSTKFEQFIGRFGCRRYRGIKCNRNHRQVPNGLRSDYCC